MAWIQMAAMLAAAAALGTAGPAPAGEPETGAQAAVHDAGGDETGGTVGTVRFSDRRDGLLVVPDLHGLRPGRIAVHVHVYEDCTAARDFDPHADGRTERPYAPGHIAELPALSVDGEGSATVPVLAPLPHVATVRGRALMIRGGGAENTRLYCGLIE